jgi:hypothetical protein
MHGRSTRAGTTTQADIPTADNRKEQGGWKTGRRTSVARSWVIAWGLLLRPAAFYAEMRNAELNFIPHSAFIIPHF